METLPYLQAFERIRAEYLEMPGMSLTPGQVQRLSGADGPVCREVLDSLVQARFLTKESDGSYRRFVDGSPTRLRTAKAEWHANALLRASRRAS